MSFIKDFFGDGDLIDIVAGGQADVADLFGRAGEREARDAAGIAEDSVNAAILAEQEGRAAGQGFLQPFADVGQRGVDQADFLANPQAQFDFLQNNPLFKLALENANRTTQASAASRGRLNAGDTLQQLSNNTLLSASPLIDRQRQDINNLLNLGSGIAQTQANVAIGEGSNVGNLLTDIGNVNVAGIAAQGAARQQGVQNAAQIAGAIFSDPRLKNNKKVIGHKNGLTLWSWDWNDIAQKLGLTGSSSGVMFDEVLIKYPKAASYKNGYGQVNYEMIGV